MSRDFNANFLWTLIKIVNLYWIYYILFCFLQLLRCFASRHRGKGTCSIGLLRRVAWGSSVTVTTLTSSTSSLVCLNLSPRAPYFESYRLEKPVPDIEENRNHYAGHTHHFPLCKLYCKLYQN